MNPAAQALAGVRALSPFRRHLQPTEPLRRGFHVAYRSDEPTNCPGCGRSQWHVGRTLAECAFCATAIPLEGEVVTGSGTFHSKDHRQFKDARYG